MESNSDKAMRDKLQGVEMPFDPAAWEQMEAMLNKDEKKRGFFWWWFGAGMASLLLLAGAGAYLALHKGSTDKELLAQEVGNGSTVGSRQLEAVSNKESIVSSANAEGNTSVGSNGAIGNNGAVGSRKIEAVGNKESSANSSSTRNPKPATRYTSYNPQLATRNTNTSNNQQQATGNYTATSKSKRAKPSSTSNPQPTTRNGSASGNGLLATNNPETTDNPVLLTDFNGKAVANTGITATQATPAKPETVAANKYWMTYLNPIPGGDNSMVYNDGNTNLPKIKAKVFQYSIGILAHGGSNIIGAGSRGNDTSYNASINLGNNFRIGFTHDFMFAKRFAISNSILFSQSSFTVNNVSSESFSTPPISFTTQIKELAIPIGIKVYPVSTPKIRFYLSAGIVNHIKMSENFSYTVRDVPKSDTTPGPVPTITNNYPTNTTFDGSATGSVETYENNYGLGTAGNTGTTTVVGVSSSEFSINNAKRYYASFYAGAGVEGIIKNKWILFAEPTFSMDLHKIGIQERRKYSIGANLGFRYQF